MSLLSGNRGNGAARLRKLVARFKLADTTASLGLAPSLRRAA